MHRRTNRKPDTKSPQSAALAPPDQVQGSVPAAQDPTRDEAGRWLPGIRSPNPSGRPKDTVSALIREAISDALTPDKVQGLAETLVKQAVSGDYKAREHLLAFFGVNLRTLDVAMAADNKVEIRVIYADEEDRADADVVQGSYSEVIDA